MDVKRSLHDSYVPLSSSFCFPVVNADGLRLMLRNNRNARRHNGLLKEHQRKEPLVPLMLDDNTIPEDFPKVLGELFALTGRFFKLCSPIPSFSLRV